MLQDRLQRTQSIAEAREALGIAAARPLAAGACRRKPPERRYTCPRPSSRTRRNPRPARVFLISGRRFVTHTLARSRSPHAQGRHPHAGRSREAQGELEHLSTEKRREVAARIKEAREFGDISENAEYDDAKNEQAMLEAKIAQLEEKLRAAT